MLRHAACTAIMLALALSGCRQHGCGPGVCNDIVPGAIPQPLGTHACQWQQGQIAKAQLDKLTIYDREWSKGGTDLSLNGRRHLEELADVLPQLPNPVVVEETREPEKDAVRRSVVVDFLARRGVADAEHRVVTGRPEAEGLFGQEAPGIAQGMVGGNRSQNRVSPVGGFRGNFRGGLGGGLGLY